MAKAKRQSDKIGLPPGSLVHMGQAKAKGKAQIYVMDYTKSEVKERTADNVEELGALKQSNTVSWINVSGVQDVRTVDSVGKQFGLHHLVVEDILNTNHRPKWEDFSSYLFLTFKMISVETDKDKIDYEQVSIILADKFVLSFQEKKEDVFDSVRNRIRSAGTNLRERGTDYLVYRLLDTVVDHYFLVIEYLSEKIEILEDDVINNRDQNALARIRQVKNEILKIRKSVFPLRDAIGGMDHDSNLVDNQTSNYLRDVQDHAVHVLDSLDTQREILSGLADLHLSNLSNSMNSVMKVLTIIATIFIPLTFIAGIYGMNFENMPELKWENGYFGVWAIMILVLLGMLYYFKRKKWL